MFEFSLFKSLFFEMDKYKMDGITETKEGQKTSRRLEVSYPSVPAITSITSQERILPYVDRYYFFVNDEPMPAELTERDVKQVIYEFYKEHFPQYLKEDCPEEMEDVNILDCLEAFNMPDYRPKHAFPGLVTLEDIRNGNVHDDKPIYAFPGLELYSPKSKEALKGQGGTTASTWKGYTEFDSDDADKARDQVNDKLADMKKQFAAELESLGIKEDPVANEEAETAKDVE